MKSIISQIFPTACTSSLWLLYIRTVNVYKALSILIKATVRVAPRKNLQHRYISVSRLDDFLSLLIYIISCDAKLGHNQAMCDGSTCKSSKRCSLLLLEPCRKSAALLTRIHALFSKETISPDCSLSLVCCVRWSGRHINLCCRAIGSAICNLFPSLPFE